MSQIDVGQLAEKPFPANHRYRIFVSKQVHDTIWKHAQESLESQNEVEVGGVLIGNIYKDKQGPFLEVTGAIAAKHTKSEGTQVTFTHETWDYINKIKDENYPDERIVGWYHTHPRFGVFLSEKDIFIQKGFFYHPWQTAFVLDPIQKTEGFFVWSQGEPKLIDEYWVEHARKDRTFADRSNRQEDLMHAATMPAAKNSGPASAVSRASFALVVAAGFLLLILLFGYVYLREVRHNETEKYVLSTLDVQQADLQRSFIVLDALRQNFEQASKKANATEAVIREQIQELATRLRRVGRGTVLLRRRIETQQQVLDEFLQKLADLEKESAGHERPAAKPGVKEKP